MADRACGKARVEEGIEDRQHAENGERDADVGYYIRCVGHFRNNIYIVWGD